MQRKKDKHSTDEEKKPQKFKQTKTEFGQLLNEVKKIGRENMRGIGKKQLDDELRRKLGLKPKHIKTPYAILQKQIMKEKNQRLENREKVMHEEAVVPKSWLPKKVKKEKEKGIGFSSGKFEKGILYFNKDRDDVIGQNNSAGMAADKKYIKNKKSSFAGKFGKKGGKKGGKKHK